MSESEGLRLGRDLVEIIDETTKALVQIAELDRSQVHKAPGIARATMESVMTR